MDSEGEDDWMGEGSMSRDDLLAGAAAVCLTIAVVAFFWAVVLSEQPHIASVQTASATTDYFSWSCQQLQNDSAKVIAQGDAGYGSWQYQAALYAKANVELQIMQLKGCSVTP